MSDLYSLTYIEDIAVMRLQTSVDLDAMLQILSDIATQLTSTKRIWVADQYFVFNDQEIRAIAAHGKTLWPEPAQIAYVADDELSFNLLRMLEIWREDSIYQIRVFHDMHGALDWLRGWDAPPGRA